MKKALLQMLGKRELAVLEGETVAFCESIRATRDSVAKTPYFLEHSLSGGDYGRDRLFKAQSGLSWLGEKPD